MKRGKPIETTSPAKSATLDIPDVAISDEEQGDSSAEVLNQSIGDHDNQLSREATPKSKANVQSSVEMFFIKEPDIEKNTDEPGSLEAKVDQLSAKFDKLMSLFNENPKDESSKTNVLPLPPLESIPGTGAENLIEFLDSSKSFTLSEKEGSYCLKCCMCTDYLKAPVYTKEKHFFVERHPSGSEKGSLCFGLYVSTEDYLAYVAGHCSKWYRFKSTLLGHLSGKESKTHQAAIQYAHFLQPVKNREQLVIKNQIRAALTVVKSKSAAVHYENQISNLHAAGADVGDFGHSRHMFAPMLKAICSFVDKRSAEFLSTCLPSTGLPPNFYITGDKSTNHRVTNQVTLICPVVNGRRQAIAVNARKVYDDAYGTGGAGSELADHMLTDLKKKLNLHGEKLLQMQGKVTDGQYLTDGFIDAMNKPIFAQLHEDMQNKFWWPLQWDPSHWLDKVFSKFYESQYISRLLSRTTLFHTMVGHGKMHAVAKATAKEMDLPFYTTMPFAKQRFLSSSYKQFTKLEKSLEVYINTYRDHNNKELNEYMIAGQDFIFDLLGIIDLLWPLVLLMLRGQALACPGWKVVTWLPLVREHVINYSIEVEKAFPSEIVCPLLSKHIKDIEMMKFKGIDLVEGWLVKKNEKGKPVEWEMREIDDCKSDLKGIARDMVDSLDRRMHACIPELLYTLQKCFDFGRLMRLLCGTRKENGHAPTSKSTLMMFGKEEFRRCINFLTGLPNVRKCIEEKS